MLVPLPHEDPGVIVGVHLGDGEIPSEGAAKKHAPLETDVRYEEAPEGHEWDRTVLRHLRCVAMEDDLCSLRKFVEIWQ